jgi:hypothetical protein
MSTPFQVDWMYYVAFAAVAVGLVNYSGYSPILYPFSSAYVC